MYVNSSMCLPILLLLLLQQETATHAYILYIYTIQFISKTPNTFATHYITKSHMHLLKYDFMHISIENPWIFRQKLPQIRAMVYINKYNGW